MSTQQGHETYHSTSPDTARDQWAQVMDNRTRETVLPDQRHRDDVDSLRLRNRQLEEQEAARQVQDKRRKKRNKIIGAGAGAAVLVGAAVGVGYTAGQAGSETEQPASPATAPAVPGEEVTSNSEPTTTMDASELPIDDFAPETESTYSPEVQEFIDYYPGRYDDPEAVYAAQVALEEDDPSVTSLVFDLTVETYEYPESQSGDASFLGFERPIYDNTFDLADQENYAQMLNKLIPNLNRYMNLVAKNPTEEQRAVIFNEFKNWTMPKNEGQDEFQDEFLTDIIAFVDEHGGATSNFYVMPAGIGERAVLDANETSSIVIDGAHQVDSIDDLGYQRASSEVSFGIAYVEFDSEGNSTTKFERLPTSQVHITRDRTPSVSTSDVTNYSIG